jgi:hypothetical protein
MAQSIATARAGPASARLTAARGRSGTTVASAVQQSSTSNSSAPTAARRVLPAAKSGDSASFSDVLFSRQVDNSSR